MYTRLYFINRWDIAQKKFKIGAFEFGGTKYQVYTLSLSLRPSLFRLRRNWREFRLCVLGIEIHYKDKWA